MYSEQPAIPSVFISILNWNSAVLTLQCIESVMALPANERIQISVIVIDNGSSIEDYQQLQRGLKDSSCLLVRQEVNLGFAGGHNLAIDRALAADADFIWLLNSDARVNHDTLARLLEKMQAMPRCGAASPLIVRLDHPEVLDFAGAVHEWAALDSYRPLELAKAQALSEDRPEEIWVVGTAILLRSTALRQVGPLDDRYFAYYEDDDICARLAAAGWQCAVVFESQVEHACFDGVIYDRPPYYFYLMARNAFRFWGIHTPAGKRRLLLIRLLETWTFMANRLHVQGLKSKSDACLLGILDGMLGRYGPPRLQRRVPLAMRMFRRMREASHRRHLKTWAV